MNTHAGDTIYNIKSGVQCRRLVGGEHLLLPTESETMSENAWTFFL